MSSKEKNIQEFLKKPIKKGDKVTVTEILGGKERKEFVEVAKVDDENVYYAKYGWPDLLSAPIASVERNTDHIGANPFGREIRNQSYQIDIEQLLWRGGFDARHRTERMEKYFGVAVPETCLNPMVIDKDGNEVEYQRGLVWSLEQKQMLIESIYNHVEIGKFVFRKRSFNWVEKRMKAGKIEHTAFADLVDGKQRYSAIVEFVEGKFPDLHGNYFNDLSGEAQRQFKGYRHLTYVELDENTSDADTLAVFLAINFSGVPMSKEHIDYVKTIKVNV